MATTVFCEESFYGAPPRVLSNEIAGFETSPRPYLLKYGAPLPLRRHRSIVVVVLREQENMASFLVLRSSEEAVKKIVGFRGGAIVESVWGMPRDILACEAVLHSRSIRCPGDDTPALESICTVPLQKSAELLSVLVGCPGVTSSTSDIQKQVGMERTNPNTPRPIPTVPTRPKQAKAQPEYYNNGWVRL